MSDKCPDQGCHDNVTRLNLFMKIVGGSVALIVVVLIAYFNHSSGATESIQKAINRNDKTIQTYVVKQDMIIDTLKEIKQTLKEITRQNRWNDKRNEK